MLVLVLVLVLESPRRRAPTRSPANALVPAVGAEVTSATVGASPWRDNAAAGAAAGGAAPRRGNAGKISPPPPTCDGALGPVRDDDDDGGEDGDKATEPLDSARLRIGDPGLGCVGEGDRLEAQEEAEAVDPRCALAVGVEERGELGPLPFPPPPSSSSPALPARLSAATRSSQLRNCFPPKHPNTQLPSTEERTTVAPLLRYTATPSARPLLESNSSRSLSRAALKP